jgi:hypothetical protein
MLISPKTESSPGLFVERDLVVAVAWAPSGHFLGQPCYEVLLRDGRSLKVSIEQGEQLLKSLK